MLSKSRSPIVTRGGDHVRHLYWYSRLYMDESPMQKFGGSSPGRMYICRAKRMAYASIFYRARSDPLLG